MYFGDVVCPELVLAVDLNLDADHATYECD